MHRNLFQYHPVFGYSFIPGIKARVDHEAGGFLVQVNDAGFRTHRQVDAAKPPGVFRILVFGDSYTAGHGASNRDRYTDVLETLVPGTEVYNFGLDGSGTDQQYLIWREIGSTMAHDLIVIAVWIENIRRCAGRFKMMLDGYGRYQVLAKPYFTLQADGRLTLHHVPPPRDPIPPDKLPPEHRAFVADWGDREGRGAWLRDTRRDMGPRVKALAQRLLRYQAFPEYADPRHPHWLLLKAILQQWVRESKRPVIIFPIPFFHHVEGISSARSVQQRFSELSDPPSVVVHDPLPALQRYSRAERRAFRFQHDAHPTPKAHRALATSLAQAVRRFLPPRS